MNVFSSRVCFMAMALILTACAEARPKSDLPDTKLTVLDEGGSSIPGSYSLQGGPGKADSCETSGSGCPVNLPEGEYNLTFIKSGGGAMAKSSGTGGGYAGSERGVGCLRATVHLTPGASIVCKKVREYSCNRRAQETMQCSSEQPAR